MLSSRFNKNAQTRNPSHILRDLSIPDLIIFVGMVLAVAGVWYIYWPAAVIVAGLTIIRIGYVAAHGG